MNLILNFTHNTLTLVFYARSRERTYSSWYLVHRSRSCHKYCSQFMPVNPVQGTPSTEMPQFYETLVLPTHTPCSVRKWVIKMPRSSYHRLHHLWSIALCYVPLTCSQTQQGKQGLNPISCTSYMSIIYWEQEKTRFLIQRQQQTTSSHIKLWSVGDFGHANLWLAEN